MSLVFLALMALGHDRSADEANLKIFDVRAMLTDARVERAEKFQFNHFLGNGLIAENSLVFDPPAYTNRDIPAGKHSLRGQLQRRTGKLSARGDRHLRTIGQGIVEIQRSSIKRVRQSDLDGEGGAGPTILELAMKIEPGSLTSLFEDERKYRLNRAEPRPQLALRGVSGNAVGLAALLDSNQQGDQTHAAEDHLRARENSHPKRPSSGVLLGREIAVLALGIAAGFGVGYLALRKARHASVIGINLLWALLLGAGALLGGYCLLLLVVGVS